MSKSLRYSGTIALVLVMTLAGMIGVQALTAAETPVRQVAPAGSTDAAKIAALERRVTQLETQLKALETRTRLINSDGATSFTVHAPGSVSLKGNSMSVESAGNLILKGSSASVTCTSFSLNAGQATVTASGTLALKSGLVTINNGGKPAARQGDAVVVAGNGTAQIAMGSPTVLIGN